MKTKKAMKKITHIGMAALVAMGMIGTSCNKAESPEIETPETQKENIVTLTTTVSFAADGTKALTDAGVKTFAKGETMAIYYWKNKGNDHEKAVSAPLTDGDITNGGKSATFTFTLDNPYKDMSVSYVYPAAMANADFTPNYDALYNNQDGTLATLASNFDFCTRSGDWSGGNLPSLTLVNQLAILAITLTNADGSSDITSGTTKLTVSDGTNTYNVSRSAAAGPIYVAIRPTSDATIDITATSGGKGYYKTLATKTYEAGNGYPVTWKMTQGVNLSKLTADYTAQNGDKLTGTLGSNVKISIADGATVTLKDANINGDGLLAVKYWAGITCLGDATIILEGENNKVQGFRMQYPGIEVPSGNTLTIQGTGSLDATGKSSAAGIGGGSGSCGNIVIKGGTVTATSPGSGAGIGGGKEGSCGAITISGGTITATGGVSSAGIGGGNGGSCSTITISGGTITATGGVSGAGIGGGGYSGSCGNITISGGTVVATGQNNAAGIGGGYQGTCGNILIEGGTVEATGGNGAAGIGGGNKNGTCGTITITSGVTSVTATKGNNAESIGKGKDGTAITVTIEAGANVTQN